MNTPATSGPDVSVVIATIGGERPLQRVLDRLALQRDAPRFEVLLVADAAARELPELRHQGLDLHVLRAARPGASCARNVGWRESQAPIVLFLGDDTLPDQGLLAAHAAQHERRPTAQDAVLGHVRWARELRVTPFMRWLERGIQFDYPGIAVEQAGWGRLYTANASLKRELIQASGGFDEETFPFGYEDTDLGYRLHRLGLRLWYAPEAEVEHLHAPTLEEYRGRLEHSTARSERRFVGRYPEVPAYFHDRYAAALAAPPARGRGARLSSLVPAWVPWLGPRIRLTADLWFRQQLAPAFMRGWAETQVASEDEGPSQPSGAEPSGPK